MSLQPNTTYYVRVKAVNTQAESDYSNIISVTTLSDNNPLSNSLLPSAIGLNTINTSNKSVDIIIDTPLTNEYIKEYQLTLSTNSDLSSPLYNKLVYSYQLNTSIYLNDGVNYCLLTVGNLVSNTTYYGKLVALNDNGNSADLIFNFTTSFSLATPELIGVSNLTQINAELDWLKVLNATGYLIDVASSSNFDEGTLVVDGLEVGDIDSTLITVLVQNTTYWARIKAKTSTEYSKYSDILSFTTLNASSTVTELSFNLNPPVILSKTNLFTVGFRISWSRTSQADYYIIDLSLNSNFSTFELENEQVIDTSYTFSSLTSGTTYYIRIKSVNSINESEYVITTVSTLSSNSALNPSQLLSVTNTKSTTADVSWIKRSYADNYLVQLSTDNFSSILSKYFLGDVSNFTLSSLLPNTQYYVRIYALSSLNAAPASNVINFNTSEALPDITLLPSTETKDKSIVLNWGTDNEYVKYYLTCWKKVNLNYSYLGYGFFKSRLIDATGKYILNVFLDSDTTYQYYIEGETLDGDRNRSSIQEFTTRTTPPVIQLSQDNEYIEWNGSLNRLEVATDKEFKFKLQDFQSRSVDDSLKRYKITNLTSNSKVVYIRGYYNGLVKGLYSNIISSLSLVSSLVKLKITDTSAFFKLNKVSSDEHRVQVFKLVESSYIPIAGHSLPIQIGYDNNLILNNLDPNSTYKIILFPYDQLTSTYIRLDDGLVFKTNVYNSISSISLNNALSQPSFTVTDVGFDRFTVNTDDSYSLYAIEISRRTDFLLKDEYKEISSSFEYVFSSNTADAYFIRLVGISADHKSPLSPVGIALPYSLPAYPAALSTSPVITQTTIINDNEVVLTFTGITDVDTYRLEVSVSSVFNLLDYSVQVVYLDNTSILLSGLVSTKTYYARIYGYNSISLSQYSNVVVISTTP